MTFEAKKDKYIKCPCTECSCVLHIWVAVVNHVCESCSDNAHEYALQAQDEAYKGFVGKHGTPLTAEAHFFQGYTEGLFAIGADTDDYGNSKLEDLGIYDIAPESQAKIIGDIKRFMRENEENLDRYFDEKDTSWSGAGCYFLIDRLHAGDGFQGENSPDEFSELHEQLHDAAQAFGETLLYLGDDGKLHVQ